LFVFSIEANEQLLDDNTTHHHHQHHLVDDDDEYIFIIELHSSCTYLYKNS